MKINFLNQYFSTAAYKLLFIFFSSFLYSQEFSISEKVNSNWFFGQNCYIKFEYGKNPIVSTSPLVSEEGCASVSDTSGNVLFFVNGSTVWNKNNQIMKNGDNINSGISATQTALIIKNFVSDSLYYIFCVDNQTLKFTYSIVNISLDNGLGEITTKKELIADSIGEKQIAVMHSNNEDIWIVVKKSHSNSFLSYLLTKNGIISSPVISTFQFDYNVYDKDFDIGYLSASPDGKKIASATFSEHSFELYDFDASSGKMSKPYILKIDSALYSYGVCFSPNSSKLYCTGYDYDSKIYQFDLNQTTEVAINNSRNVLVTFSDGMAIGAIQTGPDGNLYVSKYKYGYLSRIINPNLLSPNCTFELNAINLNGNKSNLGLPNFAFSTFEKKEEIKKPDINYHKSLIQIKDLNSKPGKENEIEITYKLLKDTVVPGNQGCKFEIKFDADIFYPYNCNGLINNEIRDGMRYMEFQFFGLAPEFIEKTLINIPGLTLLADKNNCKIELVSFTWNDSTLIPFMGNGTITVDNVCGGSLRAIQSLNFTTFNIENEIGKDNLNVIINNPQYSNCKLFIYDLNFNVYYTDFFTNLKINNQNIINIPICYLTSGVFFVNLSFPNSSITEKFLLIK